MNLPLPTQSYQSRSKPFSSQRLLNLIIDKSADNSTQSKYMLIGAPGLELLAQGTNTYPVLGMMFLHNYLIIATAVGIYVEYLVGGILNMIVSKTWTELELENPGSGDIQMASNGDDIIILNRNATEDGRGRMVVVTGDSPIAEEWTIDFPTVEAENYPDYTSVACISGVFIASCQIGNTSYVQFTDVLDTNFQYAFQLDTAMNNLRGLATNMREVWAFSPNSIEVLAPTGEAGNDFFAHVQGAYLNKGCKYSDSIATYETSFLLYGTDDVVYMTNAYQLKPISTPAIHDMIASWGPITNVIGQVFSVGGHQFYQLKFKGPNKTLWYDLTIGTWLERETGNGNEWLGEYVVRGQDGQLIVSSTNTAALYRMGLGYYTDNGQTIVKEFVFPTLESEDKKRMFYYSLTLDVDMGLAPNDTDVIQLCWSDDGGYTWGPWRQLPLLDGVFNKKMQFRRLGSSMQRTYRVKTITNSKLNVIRATIDAEEGQV